LAATLDSALATEIETIAETAVKELQVPGVAVGVIRDRQVVYSRGFGLAEVGTDRAVTSQTVFQLASESKMMVGISIMQLKEQGKLDLDAPVTAYLPYFRLADERYKQITVRQLLSHRAGLPSDMVVTQDATEDYKSPEYDEGSLERHVRSLTSTPLLSAPGQEMQYSSLGFDILGDVIAKVSGQSFEAYTQDHIFTPLGMQHTTFLLREVPPELLAAPHVMQYPSPVVNSFFPYSRQHAPAAHLFSNVEDMSRYALAQLNRGQLGETRILPAAAYEEMWAPQDDANVPSMWPKKVGLGWFMGSEAGHRLVGHSGADIGFTCSFLLAPDDGLAVIVMANRDYAAEGLAYRVMQRLLD
jgi:CubicO group peptidase (beta-lactamase class C family)